MTHYTHPTATDGCADINGGGVLFCVYVCMTDDKISRAFRYAAYLL